jgi:hypothetical protein
VEQRCDVAEEDAGLGEVRDVADEGLEVHGARGQKYEVRGQSVRGMSISGGDAWEPSEGWVDSVGWVVDSNRQYA